MPLSRSLKLGLWAFVVLDLLLVAGFIALFNVRSGREQTAALRDLGVTVYPEAIELAAFELLDQHRRPFSRQHLDGEWTLVFFGFSSCPDVCPLTLAELQRFHAGLSTSEAQRTPRIVMVTVDPERDEPEVLAEYLAAFSTEFIGLTGDPGTIRALAEQFFVAVRTTPDAGESGQGHMRSGPGMIDHSAHVSVVDPDGRLHAVMRAPHRARDLRSAWSVLSSD